VVILSPSRQHVSTGSPESGEGFDCVRDGPGHETVAIGELRGDILLDQVGGAWYAKL